MVVVQHAYVMAISDRSDQEVHGRKTVVAGASKLTLGIERAPFDVVIDRERRKRQELIQHLRMIRSVARRAAGLQEKRKADHEPACLHRIGNLIATRGIQRHGTEASPSRVVHEQGVDHERAQPERRTSSAMAGSTGTSPERTRSARR